MQPHVPPTPQLKKASNAFKHGLYTKDLVFYTPAQHDLYATILHDYSEHYQPITPDELTLVQQLAALQYRHLKVQNLQAESLREEVLRQCKNAEPDAAGNVPAELTLEARAFNALCKEPSFQLYMRELNRLPHKIQRTIDRIHLMIRLRAEVAAWPVNMPKIVEIAQPPVAIQPEPYNVTLAGPPEGEQTEQAQEMDHWPEPIASKEALIDCWNKELSDHARQVLLYGPHDWYGRLAFFRMCRIPEGTFWTWITEALESGLVTAPPKPKREDDTPYQKPEAA